MGTSRGFERLVFFTDAVTAIAITLLILPLVDLVPEFAAARGATVGGFLREYSGQIWAFLLSFVIIARFWASNHGVLEQTERQSPRLMFLELSWSFTIVVLPLPTALISALRPDRSSIAFYVGTMTASALLLTAICWELYRHPELGGEDRQKMLLNLWGVGSNAVAFVIALTLSLVFPALGLYTLLLLVATVPLDWIVKPRLHAATVHLAPGNVADTPRE